MFDAQAAAFLDAHELDPLEVTDGDLNVSVVDDQGVTSIDRAATAAHVTFSRKLHYLLANLTTDAARLVVRQNYDSNGFETWRRLVKKFALPDATSHVSLLTQLLDFKFNPQTFEQDFNSWETIKVKYEKQTGTALPDSVLVATLLNQTSGALQTHLRLNARTLTTYEEIRTTILEYHQSRHILTGASSSSNLGPAPMDIGGLKGKKGFGKGGFSHFKGKKGKGKGKKGKLGKGKGKSAHVNFHSQAMAKGKGKDKGKSKLRGQHALVCWTCGKSGHVASQCPSGRVSAHLIRMRSWKVKNLVIKVGMRMIGPQILGLRTGGLMTCLPLCLVVELGLLVGGGRLGMMVGATAGRTLRGALFSLLLLKRPLRLLHRRLLSQKPLRERQSAQ